MVKTNAESISNRIEVIDVLRGFALAGILYAHMIIWYTGASLPPEVYFKYDSLLDGVALGVFGGLVLGKFFSVFSFLFGLGFYLHYNSRRSQPAYLMKYVWRLVLLFGIGVIHHLFWRGDILAIYAVLGIILLLFRKLNLKLILFISLCLIIGIPNHIYELFNYDLSNAAVSFPMEEEAKEYYATIQNGGFLAVLEANWSSWPAKIKYQLESGRLLMTFGYFLLGLYSGRSGFFIHLKEWMSGIRQWNRLLSRIILLLLITGLIMYLSGIVSLPRLEIEPKFHWPAAFLYDVYNACMTIFYITGICILFQQISFQKLLKPLAAMGKMALTNYLLQTFFGLLLFYQFGLGLFDRTSLALNILLGSLIFYIQLKFSQYWMSRYRQGPIEWLWRGLTYFHLPTLKRREKDMAS